MVDRPVVPTPRYPDVSSQFRSHSQAELPRKGREMQNFLLASLMPPARTSLNSLEVSALPILSLYIPETTLEVDTDWVRAFITRAILGYGASGR